MKVTQDIIHELEHVAIDGCNLFITDPLDRAMYTRLNKVIEAAGGKWNRKAKAHVFDCDASDAIEQIILTGEITVPKDFGYFPSPPAVVDRLIELAQIEQGMLVLEPSAGNGNIVAGLHKAGAVVDAIEILPKNIEALKEQDFATLIGIGDFLETPAQPIYDRVVMNPPFSKQADIKHVLHALNFLKPNGLLVSVMSSSVTFRDNKLTYNFRELVEKRGGTIETLPESSFKESGTNVNTVIVTIKN